MIHPKFSKLYSKTKEAVFAYPILVFLIVMYTLPLFPTVGAGRPLKQDLERKFAEGASTVKLNTLTDFEWDKVCYYEGGDIADMSKELGFEVPEDSRTVFYHWPFYSGGLWFFKNTNLVKKIEYFSKSSRHIKIDGKNYDFMNGRTFIGNYCNNFENAMFIKKDTPWRTIPFTKAE